MSRHLVRVLVTQDLFRLWLTAGNQINPPGRDLSCTEGLPADAELVSSYMDPDMFAVTLVFHSPSLPEVRAGEPIPELRPTWTVARMEPANG